MTGTGTESALGRTAARLRRNRLYVILGANLLLLVSILLPELGYETLLARAPGVLGLAIGIRWWYRAAVGDLSRSSPEEIFDSVVDDD